MNGDESSEQTAKESERESIEQRILEVLQEPDITHDEVKLFDSRLRENLVRSSSLANRSFLMLLACTAVWIILDFGQVTRIEFFGMQFEDMTIPLVILLPVAAYFYYRWTCFIWNKILIDSTVRRCQSYLFKHFDKKKLGKLSLVNTGVWDTEVEFLSIDIEPRASWVRRIAIMWIGAVLVFQVTGMLLLLGFLGYLLLAHYPSISLWLRIPSVVMVAVLALRGVLISRQCIRFA